MKKLLVSSISLLGLSTLAAPLITSAEPANKKTKVEVQFKNKTNGPGKGKMEGNIQLAWTPAEILFTKNEKGFKLPLPGQLKTYIADDFYDDGQRLIVVNDDRPKQEMAAWNVEGKMSDFVNPRNPNTPLSEKIVADIELMNGGMKEYYAGEFQEDTKDYAKLDPTDTSSGALPRDYDFEVGGVKPSVAVKNRFVLPAGSPSGTKIISKDDLGIDPGHSTQTTGDKTGGQGYALLINRPFLKIKSGAKNGYYEADLTWTLSTETP